MVTIINAYKREKDGKSFMVLQIQGGVEMVQNAITGRFYATAKKCFIPCTFDEITAKSLIGSQINGFIKREECDPYQYTVQSTGEVITLAHTYTYSPEESFSKSSTVLALQ